MKLRTKVQNTSFEEIRSVWKNHLWTIDNQPIKPLSSLTPDFTYDMSIYATATPSFFKIVIEDQIVGVNSGYKSSPTHYRSRGLWVSQGWRKNGLSQLLLHATEKQARNEGCEILWSFPRSDSLGVYQKFGFSASVPVPQELMTYGPNWLAIKAIY